MWGQIIHWHLRVLGGEGEEPVIRWSLPGDGQEVRPGSCAPDQPRACVSLSGSMTLSYVHPEERGVYTCLAYNNQGNDSREVHLEVKVGSRVAVRTKYPRPSAVSLLFNEMFRRQTVNGLIRPDEKKTFYIFRTHGLVVYSSRGFVKAWIIPHDQYWIPTCHNWTRECLRMPWEPLTCNQGPLFQVLNIILFPVSIAANFVTLSWNTSQSLARDYILQVGDSFHQLDQDILIWFRQLILSGVLSSVIWLSPIRCTRAGWTPLAARIIPFWSTTVSRWVLRLTISNYKSHLHYLWLPLPD